MFPQSLVAVVADMPYAMIINEGARVGFAVILNKGNICGDIPLEGETIIPHLEESSCHTKAMDDKDQGPMGWFFWMEHCHDYTPVDPKPPAPRSVVVSDSTSTNKARITGAITP